MSDVVVLKGDLLWDGIRNIPIPDRSIIIENDRISEIISSEELDPAKYGVIKELPGTTVMPGLIDSHTHLSMDPTLPDYLDHMNDPVDELTQRAVEMMKKDILSGVTTCRCLGDKEFLDIFCKKEIEENRMTGPRLLVAGKGIRAVSGHGFVGYPFDGLENLKKAVRDNYSNGADLIKFYITGTLKNNTEIQSYFNREEIECIIHEAHHFGLKATAHCVGGIGLDWALEAGLDSVEHLYQIDNSQIKKLGNSTTWPVLTPSPILLDERVHHLPDNLIPGHFRERPEIKSRMMALIASGIPFAVGSDGLHGELSKEIRYLIEMGADTLTALQAATINGARVSGLEVLTGSLESGKKADIICVDGNPFEDINALEKVTGVMKEGRWIIPPV